MSGERLKSSGLFEHFNKALWETFSLQTGSLIWPCLSKHEMPMGSALLTQRCCVKPRLNQSMVFAFICLRMSIKSLYANVISPHTDKRRVSTSKQSWDCAHAALHRTIFRVHHSLFTEHLTGDNWIQWCQREDDSVFICMESMIWFRKHIYKQVIMMQY